MFSRKIAAYVEIIGELARHCGGGFDNISAVSVVRPPVILASVNSETMTHALWRMHRDEGYNKLLEHGMQNAERAFIEHFDRDGCSINDRLICHRLVNLPEQTASGGVVLGSDMSCMNHQNQLVETALRDLVGISMIGSLYRACLLFRMGSYWTKCLMVVKFVVDRDLQTESSPFAISRYNLEWVDYLEANYRQTERISKKVRPKEDEQEAESDDEMGSETWARTLGGRAWHADLEKLLTLLPTAWYGPMHHVCSNSDWCQDGREVIVAAVTRAIRNIIFRTLPCLLGAGKWTRTGPLVGCSCVGDNCAQCLGRGVEECVRQGVERRAAAILAKF